MLWVRVPGLCAWSREANGAGGACGSLFHGSPRRRLEVRCVARAEISRELLSGWKDGRGKGIRQVGELQTFLVFTQWKI